MMRVVALLLMLLAVPATAQQRVTEAPGVTRIPVQPAPSVSFEEVAGQREFSGWMIASTPALSAMDHSRYDIWVMRCATS